MFRPGKVLKVKVELAPNMVGFGRATIVETDGGHIFLQLKTSKGEKRVLPKGTRVWFVSDSIDNPFNGLWSTTVISAKLIAGKTTFECSRPKFEAVVQKRKHRRVGVVCPVQLHGEQFENLKAHTRNLSKSGAGIECTEDCLDVFVPGHYVDGTVDSPLGPIPFTARVVNPRYNWLGNKTELGFEFIKVEGEAADLLDRFLLSLGGQPRFAPEGKEKIQRQGQGQLSGWLKSTKDNIKFVRMPETQATSVLPAEDLDELEPDDDDFATDSQKSIDEDKTE